MIECDDSIMRGKLRKEFKFNLDENVLVQIRNRESAARSRAKRQEYTSTLEKRVQSLRDENKSLRTKIIEAAKAPADPYAGKLDGKPLRRTRTMPL